MIDHCAKFLIIFFLYLLANFPFNYTKDHVYFFKDFATDFHLPKRNNHILKIQYIIIPTTIWNDNFNTGVTYSGRNIEIYTLYEKAIFC